MQQLVFPSEQRQEEEAGEKCRTNLQMRTSPGLSRYRSYHKYTFSQVRVDISFRRFQTEAKKCPACEMASPRRRFFLLLGTFLPKAKLSLLVGIDRLNKSDVTSCLLDGEKLSPSFIIRLFVAPTFFFFCCFGCKCVMSGLFTHVCQLEKIHE